MDVVIAAKDALRVYRLSRLPRSPIKIEPSTETPSDFPALGYRRFAKTVAPLLEQLGLMRNGINVCLRFPAQPNRRRVVGVDSVVTTTSLPAGSFWRILPADPDGAQQLIRMDVRLFVDAPALCAIACASIIAKNVDDGELMRRVVPFAQTLGLVSELCGGYSLDPWDPSGMRPTYGIEPVSSVSDMVAYLEQVGGAHGVNVARSAAACAADGQGSPAEVALWAGLTVRPGLGGYAFERPIANKPLKLTARQLAKIKHGRLTPDFYWERFGIVVEYDGSDHAGGASVWEDKGRVHDYQVLGLTVFPLTSVDLRSAGAFDVAVGSIVTAMQKTDGIKVRHRYARIRSNAEYRQCRSLLLSSVRNYG